MGSCSKKRHSKRLAEWGQAAYVCEPVPDARWPSEAAAHLYFIGSLCSGLDALARKSATMSVRPSCASSALETLHVTLTVSPFPKLDTLKLRRGAGAGAGTPTGSSGPGAGAGCTAAALPARTQAPAASHKPKAASSVWSTVSTQRLRATAHDTVTTLMDLDGTWRKLLLRRPPVFRTNTILYQHGYTIFSSTAQGAHRLRLPTFQAKHGQASEDNHLSVEANVHNGAPYTTFAANFGKPLLEH